MNKIQKLFSYGIPLKIMSETSPGRFIHFNNKYNDKHGKTITYLQKSFKPALEAFQNSDIVFDYLELLYKWQVHLIEKQVLNSQMKITKDDTRQYDDPGDSQYFLIEEVLLFQDHYAECYIDSVKCFLKRWRLSLDAIFLSDATIGKLHEISKKSL